MKQLYAVIFFASFSLNLFSQNIGINTDGSAAESNVMLDVKGVNSIATNGTQNIFQLKSFDANNAALKMKMALSTGATLYGSIEVYDAASAIGRTLFLQPSGGFLTVGTATPLGSMTLNGNFVTTTVSGIGAHPGIWMNANIGAASGGCYGILSRGTLNAAANNDELIPFITSIGSVVPGAYTGVNFYGAKLDGSTWTKSGGTISNATGLYVLAPTFGASNYAAAFTGGNVGIGTTTPARPLEISTGQLRFSNILGDIEFTEVADLVGRATTASPSATDAVMRVYTSSAATELMRIQHDGKTGIGVGASLTSKLTVQGSDNTTTMGLTPSSIRIVNGFGPANAELQFGQGPNSLYAAIGGYETSGANNTIGDLLFGTRTNPTDANLSEKMRLNSAGNLGVGTNSPGDARVYSYLVDTKDADLFGYRTYVKNSGTLSGTSRYVRGLYAESVYGMTENRPTAYGLGFGIDGTVYTPSGNYQYNWLRGGNFTAYSQSSSATNQDALAGSFAQAYNNGTGTVTGAYGNYSQAYTSSAGTITTGMGGVNAAFTNSSGNMTNAYGAYNEAFVNSSGSITTAQGAVNIAFTNTGSTGGLTTAYGANNYAFTGTAANITTAVGSMNQVFKNSGGAATGSITNAYGVYSNIWNYHTDATGSIQNAYAFYAQIGGQAGTTAPTTSIAYYANMTGALGGTNRYGLHINNETENYLSNKLGIGTAGNADMLTVFNGTTTGTYTTSGWIHSSDARLKTNILPIANSLDKVQKLQGVYFNWIKTPDSNRQIGFIAQDVEKIIPEVVVKDADGKYGLSYGNITALLVEAMKEQQKIIDAQQKTITEQKKEIDNLSDKFIGLEAIVKTLQLQLNSSAKK